MTGICCYLYLLLNMLDLEQLSSCLYANTCANLKMPKSLSHLVLKQTGREPAQLHNQGVPVSWVFAANEVQRLLI